MDAGALELKAQPRGAAPRCAYCHGESTGLISVCPGCRTTVHMVCRLFLRGCPTLGCEHQPPRRLTVRRPARAAPDLPHAAPPPRRWWGPTLLEVVGLAAIIVALGGVVVCSVPLLDSEQLVQARQAKTRSDLEAIEHATRLFRINMKRWPTCLEELLTEPHDAGDRWHGPYIAPDAAFLINPWGHEYRLYPGDPPIVISLGADGVAGGREEGADTVLVVGEGRPREY